MLLSLLLPVLAAPPALQEEAAATPVQEAEASRQSVAQERFDALVKEVDAAYMKWVESAQALYAAAEEAGEEMPELPPRPQAEFLPRFAAAAADYVGTPDAVRFLVWIVQTGLYEGREEAKTALGTLRATHLTDPQLADLGPMLPQMSWVLAEEEVQALAAELEKATPSPRLRAWAAYVRLQPALTGEDVKSEAYLAAKQEMLGHMEQAEDAYLDAIFNSEVVVRETFGIGMVAPDISGPDLHGVDFKLSDHKGKVIFLDFWGDW